MPNMNSRDNGTSGSTPSPKKNKELYYHSSTSSFLPSLLSMCLDQGFCGVKGKGHGKVK